MSLAALVALGVIIGLVLGGNGGIGGAWADMQNWFGRGRAATTPAPVDAALQASLPVPDPTAGLPPTPLNDLLQPGLTPQEQTSIIGQMLIDYWTTVRALPDGTWDEICEKLAGKNTRQLALIPREHPALGKTSFSPAAKGPGIRLHVISSSGCEFQLIHDGPDGEPYTEDDLIRNFPPDLKL